MSISSRSLFDDASVQSSSRHADGAPLPDGFLFSGNRHESVPRALFFDTRLTPLERNAWQICRMRLSADGITTLPTYEQRAPCSPRCPAGRRHRTRASRAQ